MKNFFHFTLPVALSSTFLFGFVQEKLFLLAITILILSLCSAILYQAEKIAALRMFLSDAQFGQRTAENELKQLLFRLQEADYKREKIENEFKHRLTLPVPLSKVTVLDQRKKGA